MSKNKSDKSTVDPLDEGMLEQPVVESNSRGDSKPVSLREYSKSAPFSFDAKNYKFLLIGLGINILGFILMIGGATEDPNKFDAGELFSTTRITIAPMLIVAGYVVIMYAIMKKTKAE